MSKKFTANGVEISVDEDDFDAVREFFKEDIEIRNLNPWETNVRLLSTVIPHVTTAVVIAKKFSFKTHKMWFLIYFIV